MSHNFRSTSNNSGNSDSFEGKKYNPTGQENCWVELDFFILSFFNILWSRRDVLRQKKIFKMIKKTSGSDVIDSLKLLIKKNNLQQVLILEEFQFKYLMKNIVIFLFIVKPLLVFRVLIAPWKIGSSAMQI